MFVCKDICAHKNSFTEEKSELWVIQILNKKKTYIVYISHIWLMFTLKKLFDMVLCVDNCWSSQKNIKKVLHISF